LRLAIGHAIGGNGEKRFGGARRFGVRRRGMCNGGRMCDGVLRGAIAGLLLHAVGGFGAHSPVGGMGQSGMR
jgi:hypothetical protein